MSNSSLGVFLYTESSLHAGTGSTMSYVINIGAGAIPSQPTCVGQLGGSATSSFGTPSTLTGTYSVNSSSCTTPFSSGGFTLTRP